MSGYRPVVSASRRSVPVADGLGDPEREGRGSAAPLVRLPVGPELVVGVTSGLPDRPAGSRRRSDDVGAGRAEEAATGSGSGVAATAGVFGYTAAGVLSGPGQPTSGDDERTGREENGRLPPGPGSSTAVPSPRAVRAACGEASRCGPRSRRCTNYVPGTRTCSADQPVSAVGRPVAVAQPSQRIL